MKFFNIILLLSTIFLGSFMLTWEQNKTIDSIHQLYIDQDYDSMISSINYLTDSLEFIHEGMALNKAHALYKKGKYGEIANAYLRENPDSTYIENVSVNQMLYNSLYEAEQQIATVAMNQSGVLVFNTGIAGSKKVEYEKYIESAIDFFKQALIHDPENNEARYNYELLMKYQAFPTEFMKEIKMMVTNHEYEKALELLGPRVEKDARFKEYEDYATRLGEMVKIERKINEMLTGS